MLAGRRIETRSIDYVPLAERHGRVWQLWPVWFSGDAHLATLVVGALGIGSGGNLFWTSVAIVLGCAVGTFFMAFHSTQGPQLGLPQMIQSRPQFGYKGALLVWVVALVTYVGFNAFNQVLAAQALHQVYPGIPAASPVSIVLFGLGAAALAVLGYRSIHLAQRVVAGLMIAMLSVFTIGVAGWVSIPAGQWDPAGFRTLPFLTELFAAASYQLTWSIYVSDYSRYLPREVGVRSSFWWTYSGAFIGGVWTMLVGAVVAAIGPGLDMAAGLRHAADAIFPGIGQMMLMIAVVALVAISAVNFYGASLTLLSVWDTFRPLRPTVGKRVGALLALAVAAAGIALDASGAFIEKFGDLLSQLLYLFTPWTAINLVDFYLVRKGRYSVREIFNPNGLYGRWSWRGLVAYAVGFAVMIPFFSTGLYTGPVAAACGGADLSMLVGLPVAAGTYLLACRSLDLAEEWRRAAAADVGLESPSWLPVEIETWVARDLAP